MKLDWIQDPSNNNLPSVSLTLLIATFIGAVAAGSLELAELTKSTSLFSELFYSSCALYFGRRFSVGSKSFSSDKAEELTSQIEKKES